MTLPVFPALDGIGWENLKRAEFKTALFESLSGRESRVALRKYPKYIFKLSLIELIENREEQQLTALLGFMLQLRGMQGAFLYTDRNDNSVTKQPLGLGTGALTAYQLERTYGSFTEPVENLNGEPLLYIDDVLQTLTTDYTVSATGLVTFVTAPTTGSVISWTGSYYYRCRFTAEGYDFSQLMRDLHECSDVEFIGSVRAII